MFPRPPTCPLFPTRRSSDLSSQLSGSGVRTPRSVITAVGPAPRNPWRAREPGPRPCPTVVTKSRSEEHTSELQSLRHLVCRLLLEKKNKLTAPQKMYLDAAS